MPTWFLYGLVSAFFAAVTSILAKIGIAGIDSNLATAIRTVVILFFAWMLVAYQGHLKDLTSLNRTNVLFLVLSGLATGLSWLFYFKALQVGSVNKVVPIDKLSLVLAIIFAAVFLKEKISALGWLGVGLISLGTLLTTLK